QAQSVAMASCSQARLHFPLAIAGPTESVQVSEAGGTINPDSSTSTSIIDRQEIQQTPGATQTNSMAMITDYVPGAYMVHDQLHIRGVHQVAWTLDGGPVRTATIAAE